MPDSRILSLYPARNANEARATAALHTAFGGYPDVSEAALNAIKTEYFRRVDAGARKCVTVIGEVWDIKHALCIRFEHPRQAEQVKEAIVFAAMGREK